MRTQNVRRQERPLVMLSSIPIPQVRLAIEAARKWRWDLRAAWITGFEWPADRPVAGALIGDLPDSPVARRLRREKSSVVRLGALPHPDDAVLPAVLPDQSVSGRLAAEHFAERGFADVGFVGYHPQEPHANSHAMFCGFRDRAATLGQKCHVKGLAVDDGPEKAYKQTRRIAVLAEWLRGLPKPIGVFSFADFMMVRLAIACTNAGISIPEEVALLGVGDTELCELTPVGLSSIDPGNNSRIIIALEQLHRLMQGEPAPEAPIMVPPAGVVTRPSTDVLAVPDLSIARALRFIWDHFDQDLAVEDISKSVGVPRRTMERGFRKHLNRSVHAELSRKRVTELRRLLLTTDDPLADIAPRAGFFTLVTAHKAFHKAYGTSPGKYRAEHGGVGRASRAGRIQETDQAGLTKNDPIDVA